MSNDIFNETFMTRLTNTLEQECPEGTGQRITRSDLAEKLGLAKEFEATLGAMVKHDMLSGWSSFKGVHGGIGRVGESPSKKSGSSTPAVDQAFVDRVANVLSNLVTEDSAPVPRRVIADKLGEPGSKTEALISAALKNETLSELYSSRRGKGGGVVLRSALEAQKVAKAAEKSAKASAQSEETDSDDTDETPESTQAPEMEDSEDTDDLQDEITRALEDDLADSMSGNDVETAI